MKGQILHLDQATGEGVITGADGRRYAFAAHDLRGNGEVARPGIAVDFEVEGARAREVYPDPGAPRPALAQFGDKNRIVAALLAFFLGGFGFHKFYLGYNGAGLVMLACALLGWILLFVPTGIVWLIALIEAVIYLTRSDDEFHERYEIGRRPWF